MCIYIYVWDWFPGLPLASSREITSSACRLASTACNAASARNHWKKPMISMGLNPQKYWLYHGNGCLNWLNHGTWGMKVVIWHDFTFFTDWGIGISFNQNHHKNGIKRDSTYRKGDFNEERGKCWISWKLHRFKTGCSILCNEETENPFHKTQGLRKSNTEKPPQVIHIDPSPQPRASTPKAAGKTTT